MTIVTILQCILGFIAGFLIYKYITYKIINYMKFKHGKYGEVWTYRAIIALFLLLSIYMEMPLFITYGIGFCLIYSLLKFNPWYIEKHEVISNYIQSIINQVEEEEKMNNMNNGGYIMNIKKLNDDAIIPKYAHASDAGMDLYSVVDAEIQPHTHALIKTGIAIELPLGTEAQIRPRSGLALKHGITVLNSPGTIDSGYRGEIGVILMNHSNAPFIIEKGMKIAQMVIAEVIHPFVIPVNILEDSERGQGGFGSTGQ